jgi:hypothetical protein
LRRYIYSGLIIIWFLFSGFFHTVAAQVTVTYDTHSGPVNHGVQELFKSLTNNGIPVSLRDNSSGHDADIYVISDSSELYQSEKQYRNIRIRNIDEEGFQLVVPENQHKIIVAARDGVGAMYGLLTLAGFCATGNDLFSIDPVTENPALNYRIIKFNLPWSPYRESPATSVQLATCRDLSFWEKFLDMMAENRFNVLSLWNLHPFTYMIRPVNYPKATPFSDDELADWKDFWHKLFRMANERGIQTFIVNWNIVVSPEFAKNYGAEEFNDTSRLVRNYTRECVTQLINEYPELTGIGVTLADWMNNFQGSMSAGERENWIGDTFIKGMQQAGRKVKFLHRSVLSGSPIEMRRVLDDSGFIKPALVEVKFNWSHGHSTPHLALTHDYNSGKVDNRFWNPKPENYNIEWMIRNEDFFILRWGQPGFIRNHIIENSKNYVDGYFVGSEGYIPGIDCSSLSTANQTWQYGFQKQWLFYMLWGRLLYDPSTPDSVFEQAFEMKYGKGVGKDMLKAFTLASDMPLELASFYKATWDYTLYSEGFLSAQPPDPDGFFDKSSPFISIDELINHKTLDPDMLSIPDFVGLKLDGRTLPDTMTGPLMLAEKLENQGNTALQIVMKLEKEKLNNLLAISSELEDIRTWSYLSLYFADKLRAGVALETYRKNGELVKKTDAINYLGLALGNWKEVVAHTENRYREVPLVPLTGYHMDFSWKNFLPQVEKDIDIAKAAEYKK